MYYSNALAFVTQHLIGYKPKKKLRQYILRFILSEIVWRHWLSHISLDDVRLYTASNTPIWDKTAEVL